uniref:Uncharacterized protein n=1 Tax=Alexandrium catenella TaxID=2925 RepID=A0A7S1R7Z8_ALECA|mmetsp:Transcript_46249/g.124220  ORF Transcript_46249/g.124220 Transcript_46249/m.124220 type:complete len:168 (+) Transcript_46249:79-582(+)
MQRYSAKLAAIALAIASAHAHDAPRNASKPGNGTLASGQLRGAALPPKAAAAVGSCSAADAATMAKLGAGHADGSFPGVVARCGKGSWSFFGGFKTGQFLSCVRSGTQISTPCSECFAPFGQYAYRNCKFSCLFGSWCGRRCLDCVKPARAGVDQCTAVSIPVPTEC